MNEKSKSISIFDDDEDILSICQYFLKSRGWTVHTFPDVSNVLERLESSPPDIVLMDNWIPPVGGIVSTQLIKKSQQFQHLPVIYFSANSDVQTLAEQAGADSFIAKPFDLDQLEKTVRSWVGK